MGEYLPDKDVEKDMYSRVSNKSTGTLKDHTNIDAVLNFLCGTFFWPDVWRNDRPKNPIKP